MASEPTEILSNKGLIDDIIATQQQRLGVTALIDQGMLVLFLIHTVGLLVWGPNLLQYLWISPEWISAHPVVSWITLVVVMFINLNVISLVVRIVITAIATFGMRKLQKNLGDNPEDFNDVLLKAGETLKELLKDHPNMFDVDETLKSSEPSGKSMEQTDKVPQPK